jgi:DNA-binding NarL/FixJ family response regulator
MISSPFFLFISQFIRSVRAGGEKTMQKIRGMVSSKGNVTREGVALILNGIKNFEIVGQDGSDILKDAFEIQPDFILFELNGTENDMEAHEETLHQLRNSCSWTKIILYSSNHLHIQKINKFSELCDGYIQGPLMPGFLQKAIELACYSGRFFYLGSPKDLVGLTNDL